MKKMKALILALALGLTVAATATAVGCKDKNKEENSSSSYQFDENVESLASVKFDKSDEKVYQYESVALLCEVKGTSEKIVYTSSDESVATVDENGVVTAKDKIGEVTITAKVADVSDTCVVKVEKSPYNPVIAIDQQNYTIEKGETLEFTVATEWNNMELDGEHVYAATLAEDSQNAQATLSVEGNLIKVVGNEIESVNLVISTTVRGLYTSTAVTVNVVAPKLKILSTSEHFQPDVSGVYIANISTTDLVASNFANSVPVAFAAVKGGQIVENATIDWTIEGDAAALEGGNLIGQQAGLVTLTGTVESEGETASVQALCNVIQPELRLDEKTVIDLQEDNLRLTLESELLGTLVNAEYDGKVVSSRARGNTILFTAKEHEEGVASLYDYANTSSKLGKQELVLNTTLIRYTMDIEMYTMVIDTADELDAMRLVANTNRTEWSDRFQEYRNAQEFDGYFILGGNISYNRTITSMTDTGSVWSVQGRETDDRGFKGVFDGRGYNIDGVTVGKNPSGDVKQSGGIFGYLATGGIVKNVSFTNATLLANNGFICSRGNGTIENVSIHYKKLGGDKETQGLNSNTVRVMGSFFSYAAGIKATVKNCLVDASAADIGLEYGNYNGVKTSNMCLVGKATLVENVIALCPDTRVLETSGADIQRLTYNDLIAESELMAEFDPSIWTTVQGIPMFVNQAETMDFDMPIEFLNVKSSLVAGFDMLILTNNPYVKIEVEVVEGVTFENSLLHATEVAFEDTVTLTATSLFNPENKATIDVYIDSFGVEKAAPAMDGVPTVYNTNPILTIGDNAWTGDENYVYIGADVYSIGNGADEIVIDCEKFGWGTKDVTIVTIQEGIRTHFNTKLHVWYTSANFADATEAHASAFSNTRTAGGYTLTEVDADIEAPTGYQKVTRLDCVQEWPTALAREFFNKEDLSAYSDVWFGIKIVKGVFICKQVEVKTSDWIYFHYTQLGDNTWVAEITVDGKLYLTEFGVTGNRLADMTYRSGWSNGFLFYNNGGRKAAEETTSMYATEILGVLK